MNEGEETFVDDDEKAAAAHERTEKITIAEIGFRRLIL